MIIMKVETVKDAFEGPWRVTIERLMKGKKTAIYDMLATRDFCNRHGLNGSPDSAALLALNDMRRMGEPIIDLPEVCADVALTDYEISA